MPDVGTGTPRPPGEVLIHLRRAAGLTQEELAERSGMSIRGIRKLEAGLVARPRRSSLEALAAGLGLSDADRQRFVEHHRGLSAVPPSFGDSPAQVVPRQLPSPPRDLVGRQAELEELDRLTSSSDGAAVVISAIAGTAGIGKTALATWWGHQVADRFPDGQLFVNLRGFDPSGEPLPPAAALHGFLTALGQRPEKLPQSLDDRAALYRTLLADRRVLVVLDNARDVEQVRHLLPATAGCMALVTSRNQLTGLVAERGAHSISLKVLTEDAAVRLLESRLQTIRSTVDPASVETLSERCARLPLALVVAAARAASTDASVEAIVDDLERSGSGLDALSTDDPLTTVRSVFSWSYEALDAPSMSMFQVLGLHPGTDVSHAAAASLAGTDLHEAQRTLERLAAASLVTNSPAGRYAFHDLLRSYAAEVGHSELSDARRDGAICRLLDHYVQTAVRARRLLAPHRPALDISAPAAGVTTGEIAEPKQAADWLEAEYANILDAIHLGAEKGLWGQTCQLAELVSSYLDAHGLWTELIQISSVALEAARELDDAAAEALAYRRLGSAHALLGEEDHALECHRRAYDLYESIDDVLGQARVHQLLSSRMEARRKYSKALFHDERALELLLTTTDRSAQAQAFNGVGWFHFLLGNYAAAVDYCTRGLELATELGHRRTQAAAWDSIGCAHHQHGNFTDASHAFRMALDLWRDIGAAFYEACTLDHLGQMHWDSGDSQAAERSWKAAVEIFDELEHAKGEDVREKLRRSMAPP